MRIRIECGLDSQSRAGFWPNDRAGVRAVRTIQGGKNKVRIRFENIQYIQLQNICCCILLNINHIKMFQIKPVDLNEKYILYNVKIRKKKVSPVVC
jgi:hypothetical protein